MAGTKREPFLFVSHAAADKPFVDKFVGTLLRNGCGLRVDRQGSEIFYTARRDTGIRDGAVLKESVRAHLQRARLVIAIVSPTYQSRPMCVAEFGAAWASAGDRLLPFMTPGVSRSDLEGAIEGVHIGSLSDRDALDVIHDRVAEARGDAVTLTSTWGEEVEDWLASLDHYAKLLAPAPAVITEEEHERVLAQLESARAALKKSSQRSADLEERLRAVAVAKTKLEVDEAVLPKGERERFASLLEALQTALRPLPRVVEEAIWGEVAAGSAMLYPDGTDVVSPRDADEAVSDGYLVWVEDVGLCLDRDVPQVDEAAECAERLQSFLISASPEFEAWFLSKYGHRPNLRRRTTWRAVVSG